MPGKSDPPTSFDPSVELDSERAERIRGLVERLRRDDRPKRDDQPKRPPRALESRHEASDDLLLQAARWATLWKESCLNGRPEPAFIQSAFSALDASAMEWSKSRPGVGKRREWVVLARYLRLQTARLHSGSIDVPPRPKRTPRGLLIRHEPSDDLLLKAASWATLWKESYLDGRPNPALIQKALSALNASAMEWTRSKPGVGKRREWVVLARYLRLQTARLRSGSIDVPPTYGCLDALKPAADRAARMFADRRFLDNQLGFALAVAGFKGLDKGATEKLLEERIGPSFRNRLTKADVRLAKGTSGRPRKGSRDRPSEGSDGSKSPGADLSTMWRQGPKRRRD